MAKSSKNLSQLRLEREAVLGMARFQRELWQLFKERFEKEISESDLTIGTLARRMGIAWAQLKRYIDRTQAASGGEILDAITKYLGRADLARTITSAAKNLSAVRRGMTVFSDSAINLAFDLEEAQLTNSLPHAIFSACFGSHEKIVQGVLVRNQEALAALEKPEVAEAIGTRLKDESWKESLDQAIDQKHDTVSEQVAELEKLVGQLRIRYSKKKDLAKALEVDRSTLHNALRGDVTVKTLEHLLDRARHLVAQQRQEKSPETVSETLSPASQASHEHDRALPIHDPLKEALQGIRPSARPTEEDRSLLVLSAENLDQLTESVRRLVLGLAVRVQAGQVTGDEIKGVIPPTEATVGGVRFAITANHFTPMEGAVTEAELRDTGLLIQELRRRWDLFARLNWHQRQQVMSMLRGEINELFLTLLAAKDPLPVASVEVIEAQREGLKALSQTRKRRK